MDGEGRGVVQRLRTVEHAENFPLYENFDCREDRTTPQKTHTIAIGVLQQ